MLVFEARGKPEYPEKNFSVQSREPTNSTHIKRRVWESNPGHIGVRRVLSPLRHPRLLNRETKALLKQKLKKVIAVEQSNLNSCNHLAWETPGTRFSKVPETFRTRKAICETTNRLFWEADLLRCFQGN